ncbi:hypothetical protein COO91_02429 [Nostoc flagelliforme CCNUN1]|uniref:Uncharacterized protein n=1 Tax=Nostoc flagelliforme CCNUN1 TaxID=2038116 RepID=A0A2K8SM15_9NOSO|nr:hypothetical protein COO91_02429 [Nostoc flagelliforme CCNUN1]
MLHNVKLIKLAGTKRLQPDIKGCSRLVQTFNYSRPLILALKRQVQELI